MEASIHHSLNVQLKDRTLWFDGDSVMDAEHLTEMILKGSKLPSGVCVDTITPEIKQFNQFVPRKERILTKTECRPFDLSWNIPEEYLNMDIDEYVVKQLKKQKCTGEQFELRVQRVVEEMTLYDHHDLIPFLQTLVYVINTLTNRGIPWGVGRGSSVSSYVLYLIGVHDVDSVLYELDITDFLPPLPIRP